MNQIADQGKDPKTNRKEDLEAQPRAARPDPGRPGS